MILSHNDLHQGNVMADFTDSDQVIPETIQEKIQIEADFKFFTLESSYPTSLKK